MKRTILKYGVLSGLLSAALMLSTIPFVDDFMSRGGELVGYTGMVLAALMVFFGLRSYRETAGGGRLSFGRGLAIGLSITLVSAVFYVVTWELLYFHFIPGLGDKIVASMVAKANTPGATPATVAEAAKQAAEFKTMYDQPLYNVALTFLEPLPVGLVMSALSAAILRRREAGAAIQR